MTDGKNPLALTLLGIDIQLECSFMLFNLNYRESFFQKRETIVESEASSSNRLLVAQPKRRNRISVPTSRLILLCIS